MSADDFLSVEANDCSMSSCAAPAGSPCRTGRGKVASQYHTARFRLVPSGSFRLTDLIGARDRESVSGPAIIV
ncbi:zinc finger domain-containing protein [Nocardia gipuzkoensis]|uniref:zinc finger domain-containing protein n=1 Tax=Nocardia gipuzkoensis TaxID=2749991 RepID=UPI003F69E012